MLYLHQYPGIWNLPSLSPFCIKVETYLKMTGLLYDKVIENNPIRGPKGKMPVLRDGNCVIPDSTFIIKYLEDTYDCSLDKSLTADQRAIAHTIQRTIEENLYFTILYSRWIDPEGKDIIDAAFRPFFPKPLAGVALTWIRHNLTKQAKAQGIARHHRDEIYYIGEQDIQAIAQLFGTNTYLLGEDPHTIDAILYAFLLTILNTPLANPLQLAVKKHPHLVKYVERMQKRYF
jgi:glutathione S-transferase